MKNNYKNSLPASSQHIVLLHNDLAKLNSNEKHSVEPKTESKALYGKEYHFYEFYFLAVADKAKSL